MNESRIMMKFLQTRCKYATNKASAIGFDPYYIEVENETIDFDTNPMKTEADEAEHESDII